MARNEDAYTACPYYKRDDKQKICCEGIEPDTGIGLTFSSPARHKDYKNKYCRNCWMRCQIAQMHNRRYKYDAE